MALEKPLCLQFVCVTSSALKCTARNSLMLANDTMSVPRHACPSPAQNTLLERATHSSKGETTLGKSAKFCVFGTRAAPDDVMVD